MLRLTLAFLFLFVLRPDACAQSNAASATVATWVAEVKTIAPGSAFTVAIQLAHPPGWHSYYQNSGGLEQSLVLQWSLPKGFAAGSIQWPVPQVKDGFFGKSFVYPGTPVFLVDISVPADFLTGQTVEISAAASWQICADSCRNEQQTLTLNLPVAATSEKDPSAAPFFAAARAAQAARAGTWKIAAQAEGRDILLRIEPAAALEPVPTDFIPNHASVQAASAGGSIRRDGEAWLILLKRAEKDALDKPVADATSVSGILLGARAIAIPDTAIASPDPRALPLPAFLKVLAAMLLGGLILNLMPCVFPVIGLKIMNFVHQAGDDRKKTAAHGLSFTFGVFVSFALLSGILFATRAVTGWGYQLQNPWVVGSLMVLMWVLALNMFGIFEMGVSATSIAGPLQSKPGIAGSFFSGALATVVATPCSGPFLGVALGVAISLPPLQFFAAFAAMALGLSLPYLILSVFPGLIRLLPRPGVWMESFKQAMSFLLFATAGYLLMVYAGQIGLENLLEPVLGLSAIAVAAWIHGRWNLPSRPRSTRRLALVLTVIFASGGLFLAKPPHASAISWETWSPQRVEALAAEGTPVYIDFTALWCPTCLVNKKRAYTHDVIALMKEKHVVALKADKTQPNPQIEAALRQLGRTAIPVNVLLVPGKEPLIFPELLSPAVLLDALRNL